MLKQNFLTNLFPLKGLCLYVIGGPNTEQAFPFQLYVGKSKCLKGSIQALPFMVKTLWLMPRHMIKVLTTKLSVPVSHMLSVKLAFSLFLSYRHCFFQGCLGPASTLTKARLFFQRCCPPQTFSPERNWIRFQWSQNKNWN